MKKFLACTVVATLLSMAFGDTLRYRIVPITGPYSPASGALLANLSLNEAGEVAGSLAWRTHFRYSPSTGYREQKFSRNLSQISHIAENGNVGYMLGTDSFVWTNNGRNFLCPLPIKAMLRSLNSHDEALVRTWGEGEYWYTSPNQAPLKIIAERDGIAKQILDSGLVVGLFRNGFRPFRWTQNRGFESCPMQGNDQTQVGTPSLNGDIVATHGLKGSYLWTKEGEVRVLGADPLLMPTAVNDNLEVIGRMWLGAFYWTPKTPARYLKDMLVAEQLGHWYVSRVMDINNQGVIVGLASKIERPLDRFVCVLIPERD